VVPAEGEAVYEVDVALPMRVLEEPQVLEGAEYH